jgi:hypothetical protein
VSRIQTALYITDGLSVSADELKRGYYGESTASAVLAFKTKRRIINYSYETKVDNIVGKMTIAALDNEVLLKEILPRPLIDRRCYAMRIACSGREVYGQPGGGK